MVYTLYREMRNIGTCDFIINISLKIINLYSQQAHITFKYQNKLLIFGQMNLFDACVDICRCAFYTFRMNSICVIVYLFTSNICSIQNIDVQQQYCLLSKENRSLFINCVVGRENVSWWPTLGLTEYTPNERFIYIIYICNMIQMRSLTIMIHIIIVLYTS